MKIYYFTSTSCSVCKSLKPQIKNMVDNLFSEIVFEEYNIDENPEISGQKRIFSVPTIIIEVEGKEHLRFNRNLSIKELKDKTARIYNLYFN